MSRARGEKTIVFLVFVTPNLSTAEGRDAVVRRLSRDLFWTLPEGWRIEYWGYRPDRIRTWGPVRLRGPRLPHPQRLSTARVLVLFATHFLLTLRRRRTGVQFVYDPYVGFGATMARLLSPGPMPLVAHVAWGGASRSFAVRGSRVRSRFIGAVERFVLRRADLVIAVGEFTRQLARRAGTPDSRILELPGPPSWESDAAREPLRAFLSVPEPDQKAPADILSRSDPSVTRIVCAARLDADKGIDVLLQAFALVAADFPSAQLEMAGDGSERPKLERLADRLGIADRVSFLGWVPGSAMQEFFRDGLANVLPSVFEEGLPKVCMEAGLAGCALIGSDIGGIRDVIIPGETGIRVPPGDPRSLAAALRQLLIDPDEARRLGAGARRRSLEHLDRRREALEGFRARMDTIREPVDRARPTPSEGDRKEEQTS